MASIRFEESCCADHEGVVRRGSFRADSIDLFVCLKGAFRYALGLTVASTTQAKNIEDTLALLNVPQLGGLEWHC